MTATRRGFARRTKTPRRRCIRAAARRPDGSVTRGGPQTLLLRAVPAGATPADGQAGRGAAAWTAPSEGRRDAWGPAAPRAPESSARWPRGEGAAGWVDGTVVRASALALLMMLSPKKPRGHLLARGSWRETHTVTYGADLPLQGLCRSPAPPARPHAARRATAGLRPRPARPRGQRAPVLAFSPLLICARAFACKRSLISALDPCVSRAGLFG